MPGGGSRRRAMGYPLGGTGQVGRGGVFVPACLALIIMATSAYIAPGMKISEVVTRITAATDISDGTTLDEVITAAGQAACNWYGKIWWWMRAEATFATVADQGEYNLRLVDADGAEIAAAVAADLWAPTAVYYDNDWPLAPISKDQYEQNTTLLTTVSSTIPFAYTVWGEPPVIGFWPAPAAAYSIYVKYIKRHSKIVSSGDTTSSDAALIVPAEYQRGVYVDGATWLLNHQTLDPASLEDCKSFMDAMQRMSAAEPLHFDLNSTEDKFPDSGGSFPHDRRVLMNDGQILIENPQTP